MHILKQFGLGRNKYIFTAENQAQIQPYFGDNTPQTIRLAGMDGGMSVHSDSRPPSGVGNVQAYIWLHAETPAEMETKQQAVMAMASYGLSKLFKERYDGTLLWTWAVVTNIEMSQSAKNVPHKQLQYQINFNCEKSRWYGKTGMLFLDDGLGLDDGLTLPGPQIDRVTKTTGQTITITNDGDAPAGAYIWLEAPASEDVTDCRLTRLSDDGVSDADWVQYTDTISDSEVVIIDGRDHSVQENYVVIPDFGKLDALRAAWMEFLPGENTLTVTGTFTNGVILSVDCWNTYR